MNRKNLTAAVLAGLAGTAGIASTVQAVNINPNGLGQVLIYPYYTTNGGNLTLLSVVNTSEDAKAVKVRFLEGMNSIEVLDFNLYMSAYDVWTAALLDGATVDTECNIDNGINENQCGVPHLLTTDTTCTVPYLFQMASTGPGLQTFLTAALKDGGPTSNARISEGHFEMIEMGTLVDEQMGSAEAATHVSGVPEDCQQLVDAWTQGPDGVLGSTDDGYWLNEVEFGALTDIEDPSGGLFGGAAVINPGKGTMYSYDATAINGFANSREPFGIALHSFPGTEAPSLGDGDRSDGRVFGGSGNQQSTSYANTIDAVSYVFMHDSIMNEYNIDPDIAAQSEWVVTFPTKNFYVNTGGPTGIAPFVSYWTDNDGDSIADGACEPLFLDTVWDREEAELGADGPGDSCPPVVSPGTVTCGEPSIPFELCLETNVLRFGALEGAPAESEIFSSARYTNFDPVTVDGFTAGWARIDMYAYPADSDGGGVFDTIELRDALGADDGFDGRSAFGLPVTGFWAMQITNGFIEDPDTGELALGNYGGLFRHKATYCFAGESCRDDLLGPVVQ